MEDGRRFLRVERRHCPHCNKSLSLRTYKAHKRLHFDDASNVWVSSADQLQEQDADESPPPLESESDIENSETEQPDISPPSFYNGKLPCRCLVLAGISYVNKRVVPWV